MTPDHGGRLRLALAAAWLLDAALQYQPFMFTRAFGQSLAMSAQGNPRLISDPITWSAGIIEQHPTVTNAAFATIQLIIALGIAWRPAVKFALAASVAWSVAVWWLGEGLGGVLTGAPSAVAGAPGAVILYALLAVLLWPEPDGWHGGAVAAGSPLGPLAARLAWVVLWGSLAYDTLLAPSQVGLAAHVAGQGGGEPGWLAAIDRTAGRQLAAHGAAVSVALAVMFAVIAVAVFIPAAARPVLAVAIAASLLIWLVGQNLGGILTGQGTDPNTGPLLALLTLAYWPRRPREHPRPADGRPALALPARR
jgi:hypothetical protein